MKLLQGVPFLIFGVLFILVFVNIHFFFPLFFFVVLSPTLSYNLPLQEAMYPVSYLRLHVGNQPVSCRVAEVA